MCPSYRATHEEEHSTRGRAHLLWEMTQGKAEDAVIRDGWRSEEVKHSLDLCLACKGCKSDCPVSVDVATYKAEFLSHYYEGRLRPRSAYAFGNIDLWARLASNAPGLVNLTTQLPFLRDIAKLVAGIPPQRTHPRLRPRNFQAMVPPHARNELAWATDAFVRPAKRSERAPKTSRPEHSSPTPSATRSASKRTEPLSLAGPPLARHLQQLLPPRHRPRRRRSPRSRRIPRPRPPSQPLLRTPSLRLRHARPRRAPAPRHPRPTRARDRSRHPHRRTRTQLRRRLPRRTPQPLPARPARPSPEQTNIPAQRIPRTKLCQRAAPATSPQSPAPRTLPSQIHHEDDRRRIAPHAPRHRLPIPRPRMLRHGRILRLRAEKTSTTSPRPSANSNSSPPSARRPPTGSSSPTDSAAASRSPKAPTATPCTWPKSSKWRSMLHRRLVIPTEAGAHATA